MKQLIWILLVLNPLPLFADSNQVCDDLYRLTCASGTYDDGTGTAKNPSVLSPTDNGLSATITLAQDRFAKILKDPNNTYFRKLSLSATGLALNPDCDGAEDTPSDTCVDALAKGDTDILAIQSFAAGYAPTSDNAASLQDKSYLINSPEFMSNQQQFLSEAKKTLDRGDTLNRVQNQVFPNVQKMLLEKVSQIIQDPTVRKNMTDRIRSIRFAGTDCSKDMTGSESVTGLLIPNAFYSTTSNTFKFCAGLTVDNNSEFMLAFVIAHELSHSIDPCGVTLGPQDYAFKYKAGESRKAAEKEFVIGHQLNCLRSTNSLQASVNPMSGTGAFYQPTPADNDMAQAGSSEPYGGYGNGNSPAPGNSVNDPGFGKHPPFTSFCKDDQITESFADWMAAEILPDYIQKFHPGLTPKQLRFGYSNVWRGSCRPSSGTFDVHPSTERRTNYLILVQPKIRAQMACPPKLQGHSYCAVDGSGNQDNGDSDSAPPNNRPQDNSPDPKQPSTRSSN